MNLQVRSQFSSARKVGEETIQLINNTIESVDEGLTCFSAAKRVAQNASDTARMAHNVSREARRVRVLLNLEPIIVS